MTPHTPNRLRGEDLSFTAGRATQILAGVDFTMDAGRVTGVLGPNGSGKTTLLRTIIGALPPTTGRVLLEEGGSSTPLTEIPRLERARTLAMVEQDAHTHEDLTAREVIALGRLPHLGRFGGSAHGDPLTLEAARRTGVEDLLARRFATLSGGERQRVHLARAFAQDPEFLLLDEPTNHLDVSAQLDLIRLIREAAGQGAGVMVTLHDLSLAARACDEVIVLDGGRLAAAGTPKEVLTPGLIRRVWNVHAEWVRGSSTWALVYE